MYWQRFSPLLLIPIAAIAHNCSWNYRFDAEDNHFNIVYPDRNAVYYGMVIPKNTSNVLINSERGHPVADYFSIQIYDGSDLVNSLYHYSDFDLLTNDGLTHLLSGFNLVIPLDNNHTYFFLFRIYGSRLPSENLSENIQYWSGFPPTTYIDDRYMPICDIDYSQQGNIYTNIAKNIYPTTDTVCLKNEAFLFMDVPAGSLANADANYMIACIEPGASYKVKIKVPRLMCSLGYIPKSEHPYINENYDMRYISLSVVSTTAPRPTISTYQIPCALSEYTVEIQLDDDVVKPGLLYRQLLPNPDFPYSIAKAKNRCYDYANRTYDDFCIISVMGEYYPIIIQAQH